MWFQTLLGLGAQQAPVPRQNLIRLGQERRDPSIRPQAKTPSLVGGRATGFVRPSALHGHTGVAMEDGEQVGWAAELNLGRVFDGSEDSRCWTGLRRLAEVAVMQATDFGNLHDPT